MVGFRVFGCCSFRVFGVLAWVFWGGLGFCLGFILVGVVMLVLGCLCFVRVGFSGLVWVLFVCGFWVWLWAFGLLLVGWAVLGLGGFYFEFGFGICGLYVFTVWLVYVFG